MNPLFQVGEKVRLVSKSHPEYNGEYFVERVVAEGETYIDRIRGDKCKSIGGFGYLLDELLLSTRDVEVLWAESALRKIYPPSTESFDEMLRNIKQGKIIDNLVGELV